MANELEFLTVNAGSTSWVDNVPSAVSTGYQAQNTNIEANRLGIDESYAEVVANDVILKPSGIIDDNGIPITLISNVTLTPATNGVWYIKVIAGATSTQRSLELTANPGLWDSSKGAYYDTGARVLNWLINKTASGMAAAKRLPLNQHVDEDLSVGGSMLLTETPTFGSWDLTASSSLIIPRGVYNFSGNIVNDWIMEIFTGSTWFPVYSRFGASTSKDIGGFIVSNGSHVRLTSNSSGAISLSYQRY